MGALFAHDSNFELIEIKKLTSHRIRESIETDAGQNIFCGFGRCIKCEKLRWRGILVALRDGIKCENFGWTWTGRMKDWLGGWRRKLGLGLSWLVDNFFSHHLHWMECVNCNSLTKYERNTCLWCHLVVAQTTCLDQAKLATGGVLRHFLWRLQITWTLTFIYQLVNHHENLFIDFLRSLQIAHILNYQLLNHPCDDIASPLFLIVIIASSNVAISWFPQWSYDPSRIPILS